MKYTQYLIYPTEKLLLAGGRMDGHAANDLKDDFMFFKNYSHIILAKFYNYAIT